jgi:hypothetical protein
MKLLRLGSIRKLRQAARIACMPFVFAYIAFNVLDLDGSNLISLTRYFERSIIDCDIEVAPRLDPLLERTDYLEGDHILTPNNSPDQVRCNTTELRTLTRLEKARTHGYHVSLPRDSVPG